MPITEKPKLLVVDDDPDFLELCWICLSKDFRVELAGNADEAVEKLGKSRPSAVLLDLRMPRVSGVEVLKYMQMWPSMRRIPVIIITASELNDRLDRMLRAHGNVYNCFEKTVSLDAVSVEAQEAVLVGELYSKTPPLLHRIARAETIRKKRAESKSLIDG